MVFVPQDLDAQLSVFFGMQQPAQPTAKPKAGAGGNNNAAKSGQSAPGPAKKAGGFAGVPGLSKVENKSAPGPWQAASGGPKKAAAGPTSPSAGGGGGGLANIASKIKFCPK